MFNKYSKEWWEQRLPLITALVNGEAVLFDGEQENELAFDQEPGRYKQVHNPKRLTQEQVGDGWRLMYVGEEFTDEVEFWAQTGWQKNTFRPTVSRLLASYSPSYRIPIAPGTDAKQSKIRALRAELAELEGTPHV